MKAAGVHNSLIVLRLLLVHGRTALRVHVPGLQGFKRPLNVTGSVGRSDRFWTERNRCSGVAAFAHYFGTSGKLLPMFRLAKRTRETNLNVVDLHGSGACTCSKTRVKSCARAVLMLHLLHFLMMCYVPSVVNRRTPIW